MVSTEFAGKQIARLDATSNFHMKTDPAIGELVETLRVNANDEHEAEAAVSLWIQHERECPTPADVRNALAETREGKPGSANPEPPRGRCADCKDLGYVMVDQIIGQPGNERVVMAAKRCGCRA